MTLRITAGGMALAAVAGASAWFSLGTLAVTSHDGSRVGALPSFWVLGLSVVTAILLMAMARLSSKQALPLTLLVIVWIPWLPVPLPTSLLLWEGPTEVLVWVAALGGLVVQFVLTANRGSGWWRNPSRAPWIAGALLFACSIGSAAVLRPALPGGDEPHYLVIAQSLLYDGDLKIENNHRRGDFLQYVDRDLPPHYLKRGRDGEIYSIHAPGVATLLLPAFAVAGYPGAVALLAALSGLAVAVLWRAAYLVTTSAGAAWIGVIVVATSATFFLHTFTIFPDPVGAVLMAFVVWFLARVTIVPATVSRIDLLYVGAALAALPWLHTRFALLAAAAGVVIAARLARPSSRAVARLAAFLAVPMLSAIAWLAFFYAIYGTPDPSAPYGDSRQTDLMWIPSGLAGLLFDQQFGLLANAPALVLLPIGGALAAPASRRLLIEYALVAIPYVAAVAAFAMWWGGWSAPARFLVALMPLAVLPMANVWATGNVALRSTLVALTIVGGANVAARVLLESGGFLYNTRDGFDLLLDWLSRTINLPLAFPSVHRLGTEVALQVASVWLISAAVGVLVLACGLRREQTMAVKWTVTGWTFAACVAVAMSSASTIAHTVMLTPESSELHFVQRWRPGERPLSVRIASWRLAKTDSALGAIELRSSARAREVPSDGSLMALRRVPAGDYRVVVEGNADLAGALTLSVGATALPLERWTLEGLRAGVTPFVFRAPSMLHSVSIRGDATAMSSLHRVSLRAERVEALDNARARVALRAARYGDVRAFFLDDLLYMEPGGIWTVGNGEGELIVVADAGTAAGVAISAGPVATEVSIAVNDDRVEEVTLKPGERRLVTLPAGLWHIETKGMFRPVDHDAANTDARPLGARLEFQ
jgi:hypothetical protein